MRKADQLAVRIVLQMETVVIVVPIITGRPPNVIPAVAVKQVQLGQHRRLLVLKVMEVRVHRTVTVPRVRVVDRIVAMRKANQLVVRIVIQMVIVSSVIQTITDHQINVTNVQMEKQVKLALQSA